MLEVEYAAALHDIGKIGVADSILRKADSLEPAEWKEMRRHSELGYEILKWETDTPRPAILHPLTEQVALEKARLLAQHYPSQSDRDWFDDRAFLGLARIRGVQSHAPYAEGFVIDKATITFGEA